MGCEKIVMQPLCWDTDFSIYLDALSSSERDLVNQHGYCLDCTPAYRDSMLSQGRCSYPHTQFYVATTVDLPATKAGVLYLERHLIGVLDDGILSELNNGRVITKTRAA